MSSNVGSNNIMFSSFVVVLLDESRKDFTIRLVLQCSEMWSRLLSCFFFRSAVDVPRARGNFSGGIGESQSGERDLQWGEFTDLPDGPVDSTADDRVEFIEESGFKPPDQGKVVAISHVGGFHHEYRRAA
jgi:hypothetical protein